MVLLKLTNFRSNFLIEMQGCFGISEKIKVCSLWFLCSFEQTKTYIVFTSTKYCGVKISSSYTAHVPTEQKFNEWSNELNNT